MLNLRKLLRESKRRFESTRYFGRLAKRFETFFAERAFAGSRDPLYDLVVLASDGRGNIGDQAMFESICEQFQGKIAVIAESIDALDIPPEFRKRVTFTVIPGLISRPLPLRIMQSREFWRVLSRSSAFGVVGADVMDGHYSPGPSVLRAVFADVAAQLGVPSRVFAFSISTRPTKSAVHSLTHAARAGALLLPRDPASYSRLISLGVAPLGQAADLVFGVDSVSPVADIAAPRGRSLALINASGLIDRSVDLTQDYVQIIQHVRDLGLIPVLLPHVLRDLDNDLDPLRRIHAECRGEVALIERQLAPSQVRWLASHAALTVTGRMHLAIMSIRMGAVPFTLATVGKVEGLFALTSTPGLAIQPATGFSLEIKRSSESLALLEPYRSSLRSSLPTICALAESNFDGLPGLASE